MNNNDKFHGTEFDANAQAISDDELDTVVGGANLDAWFESGRSGAPVCTNVHACDGVVLFGKLIMNSYWKNGSLYVECPFCKVPKKL